MTPLSTSGTLEGSVPAIRRDDSLTHFLVRRLLLFTLPIVFTTMALHWHWESELVRRVFDDALRERVTSLATLVTRHDGRIEFDFADEYMTQYSRQRDPFYFQIWFEDGTTLERSRSLGDLELPRRVGSLDEPQRFSTTLADGRRVRAVGMDFPIREGSTLALNPADQVHAVVGVGEEGLVTLLRAGALQVLVTGLLTSMGILIAVVVSLGLGRRLLGRVAEEVRSIDPRNLDRRLETKNAPVEVRPILDALNSSLDVIAESVERERRFASDVAHELRTPVAELRALTEVSAIWPDQNPPGEALRECHDVGLHMERIVESLLQLARVEAEADGELEAVVDVAELARAQVRHLSEKGVSARLSVRIEGVVIARGTETLWNLVLRNLLDNALEHSPADSSVAIQVVAECGGAGITVENQADDLHPEDIPRLTRRLWRGRAKTVAGHHAGLGLSITLAACTRLGAQLSFRLENGSLCAQVRTAS